MKKEIDEEKKNRKKWLILLLLLVTFFLSVGVAKTSLSDLEEDEKNSITIKPYVKDSRNTLSSISIPNCVLNTELTDTISTYSCTVESEIEDINIKAVAKSDKAIIEGTGIKELSPGKNLIKLKVTAEDGSEKIYEIEIEKKLDEDNTLKSLGIKGYTITPIFSSNQTLYKVTTEEKNIEIIAEANSKYASVKGIGKKQLKWGENQIEVEVTSQSGKVKVYKIIVSNIRPTSPQIEIDKVVSNDEVEINVTTQGSALSDIAYYEYWLGEGVPTEDTEATGKTEGKVNLTTLENTTNIGKIYYRTVSKEGYKSEWSEPQQFIIDRVKPVVLGINGTSEDWSLKKDLIIEYENVITDIKSYCYYVSNNKTLEDDANEICGTSNQIEVNKSGKYIFFELISGSGVSSGVTDAYDLYVDSEKPTVPELTGGSEEIVRIEPEISVLKSSEALSGIKNYEFYISNTDEKPTESTTASGITDNKVSISNEGIIYTWYRSVSNVGLKSDWSNVQITNYKILLETALKKIYPLIEAAPTLTGTSFGTKDKNGLYESTDTNSGNPTYYLRGNIKNNYVSFANQTWRIVRINEDGTIRLIMQNGINNNRNYKFHASTNDLKYMYYTNSQAKTELETWFNTNIANNEEFASKVVTGEYYCEQARVVQSSNYIQDTNVDMVLSDDYTPNFKCENDANGKGIVNASVGLITYDELVFAGGYDSMRNVYYYLSDNENFWSMSPAGYKKGSFANAWHMYEDGRIDYMNVNEKYMLLPVINIRSDVFVTGEGSKTIPFVIS